MTMVIRSETLYIEKLRNSIPADQILKNKLKKINYIIKSKINK